MSNPTQTPWRLAGNSIIRAGDNDWIASLYLSNRAANGPFIIRSANAHVALVEALGEFVILGPGKCTIGKAAIDKARAALKLAGEP
jgi:hypothetical protein